MNDFCVIFVYNRLSSCTDSSERAKKLKNEGFAINAITGGNGDDGSDDDPSKNFCAHSRCSQFKNSIKKYGRCT